VSSTRREPAAIAWIAGRWGQPEQLSLPLNDRGLLLADGLFETVLLEAGQPRLLAEHLARWRRSAALLGMAEPPAASVLEPLIREAVARSGIGDGALRLNWSRGSGGRGLDPPAQVEPRFWLQLTAYQPLFAPVRCRISNLERRQATLLSRCKTFAYGGAIQARREAQAAGDDDALLLGEGGQLCCASAANLLVQRKGRWLTPPLSSGCLPGVMRERGLELGLIEEAEIQAAALLGWGQANDGACLLINSLSCRPLASLNGHPLPPTEPGALWTALCQRRPND
jgi:branched-subunit amino acid aminotransferase/4-amino-4-deoxychorismate lyase